eukprot:12253958-Karenia_brevis.AAC.1
MDVDNSKVGAKTATNDLLEKKKKFLANSIKEAETLGIDPKGLKEELQRVENKVPEECADKAASFDQVQKVMGQIEEALKEELGDMAKEEDALNQKELEIKEAKAKLVKRQEDVQKLAKKQLAACQEKLAKAAEENGLISNFIKQQAKAVAATSLIAPHAQANGARVETMMCSKELARKAVAGGNLQDMGCIFKEM